MELVTWVMEELKSKQETVRHSKTSNSRKQPTTPRLKGPREEVVEAGPWGQGHPEVPQPGGPQRGEEHWFLLPPSGQTQAEPGSSLQGSEASRGGLEMEGRTKGLVHLLDLRQTPFSTLSKGNLFTPRR